MNQTNYEAFTWTPKQNGWNAPADLKKYISPHWTKFEETNPMMHQLMGFLYVLFTFFSLTGNGVVIYLFLKRPGLRTPGNMFVVNLALCDFIMMLKTPIFIIQSFNLAPIYDVLGCHIFGWMGTLSGVGTSTSNAAIAWDRYKTIASPFGKRLSRKTALLVIAGIWLYALPAALLPGLEIWGRFVPEGYLTSCTFDYMTEDFATKRFVNWIFVWAYCIPVSIIITCYYKIFSHVKNHEEALKAQAKKMNVQSLRSGDAADVRQEIRVAKVGLTLTTLFLFSWTPYAIVAHIAAFGNRDSVTAFVSMIPALTCKFSACIDPYIYAINHPKFRIELQQMMPWFCIHEPAEASETASSTKTEATETATTPT